MRYCAAAHASANLPIFIRSEFLLISNSIPLFCPRRPRMTTFVTQLVFMNLDFSTACQSSSSFCLVYTVWVGLMREGEPVVKC